VLFDESQALAQPTCKIAPLLAPQVMQRTITVYEWPGARKLV